jgi:hypothetical protein
VCALEFIGEAYNNKQSNNEKKPHTHTKNKIKQTNKQTKKSTKKKKKKTNNKPNQTALKEHKKLNIIIIKTKEYLNKAKQKRNKCKCHEHIHVVKKCN